MTAVRRMEVSDGMPASTAVVEAVRWDLSRLYSGPDDDALQGDLARALEEARSFAERHHGRVAELSAPELAEAIGDLELIRERMHKVETFAHLHFCTDTADAARGALLQKARERSAAVDTQLLFFRLEWVAVPDERAAALVADPELEKWRHFLESARRFRPHVLSELEEKLLAEKVPTGPAAWGRLFTQVTEAIRVALDGREVTLDEALAELHGSDRSKPQSAGRGVT